MYKKGTKILVLFLLSLHCAGANAQFNTLRNTGKRYAVVQDTVKMNRELSQKRIPDPGPGTASGQGMIHNEAGQPVGKSFFKKIFSLPTNRLKVNSKYGFRKDPVSSKRKFHAGVDIAASKQEVRSIMPGTIKEIGYDRKGLGNFVRVSFYDFVITYAHLKTSIGSKGDVVRAGDVIGISGSTGRSTGDHLHVSIKFRGKYVDPLPVLRFIQDENARGERE